MFGASHDALILQFRMDALIDLHARTIVRRNHECPIRRCCVLLCNRPNPSVVIGNLVDPALPIKILDSFMNLPARELFNDPLQFRVSLAHDFFKPHRHYPRILNSSGED